MHPSKRAMHSTSHLTQPGKKHVPVQNSISPLSFTSHIIRCKTHSQGLSVPHAHICRTAPYVQFHLTNVTPLFYWLLAEQKSQQWAHLEATKLNSPAQIAAYTLTILLSTRVTITNWLFLNVLSKIFSIHKCFLKLDFNHWRWVAPAFVPRWVVLLSPLDYLLALLL